MITNLYIDGFNLYYRALKDTPFRWLDLRKLAETLFPQDSINRVCYFTARLDTRPGNPSQRQRQQAYLRALATLPGFDAYYGVVPVRRQAPSAGKRAWWDAGFDLTYVLVRDSEEKGSDVNLATSPAGVTDFQRGVSSRRSWCPTMRTSRISGRCAT